MTTGNTDLDTLASEAQSVTLESGLEIEVVRLRTRQTMSLLKIITRGAGPALSDLVLGADTETEQFTAAFIGAVVFSIPEAEDETIDFIRSMVIPAGLITDPKSKPEKEVNQGLLERLHDELENPELEDLVTIVEKVITNEAPHIVALGKRLAGLISFQRKVLSKSGPAPKTSSKKGSAA